MEVGAGDKIARVVANYGNVPIRPR
jgi:hypothetical protein